MPKVKFSNQILPTEEVLMRYGCQLRKLLGLKCKTFIGIIALLWLAQAATPPFQQTGGSSEWTTFTNRAGWSIRHPVNFKVGSCRQCSDPTNPDVFVTFLDPSTSGFVMIEHLLDKPADQSVEKWLDAISRETVANPRASEEWVYLDGAPALKVKNRNPDSTESENVYVVNGSTTFAVRVSNIEVTPFYLLCRQMISTFRFARR